MWSKKYKLSACRECGLNNLSHQGLGLCVNCYGALWRRRRGIPKRKLRASEDFWSQTQDCCAGCGSSEAPHAARGLCKKCYWAWHRRTFPEKWSASNRRFYQSHREEELARSKRYRELHPEKRRVAIKRWLQNNPGRKKYHDQAYHAKKRGAEGVATPDQILARIEYYGGLCYLCGKPYEALDHLVPLSKGGTNWPANLRPVCKSCNSYKHAKTLQEFIGLTD